MFITIFVKKSIVTFVIRRIDIDTFHLLAVARLQELQGLKVVGVNQQAVGGGVKAFAEGGVVGERQFGKQLRLEGGRVERGIDGEVRV
ncbi:hypothetical protein ACFFOT_09365 [Cardiobacterium valvarum]|uniref:Uncharacterized protein n=1 Tax=Cardiobacterium valvarum TaxID=194702 RepID=A0A381E6A6_9GAMM|nr:hypothetical protein [Cardiobacterium valvarum]SUX22085.1 Uncharacterised protein [Cardiobacterium valvarum]